MMKALASVVAGLFAWFVVATIVNLAFRFFWPGYAEAEAPMRFTLGMMMARLALGALSSVCAGLVAARIAKSHATAVKALGVVLVALFVPIHYGLWDKFPVWYHFTFLLSLLPLTILGAALVTPPDRVAHAA